MRQAVYIHTNSKLQWNTDIMHANSSNIVNIIVCGYVCSIFMQKLLNRFRWNFTQYYSLYIRIKPSI